MLSVRIKLENTINSLLDKALPNDFQKFKIYKHFVRYYDYKCDFFTFNARLFDFFAIPRKKRCNKEVDRIFKIKITAFDFELLNLGFHNAIILQHDIFAKATEVKWVLTNNFKIPAEISTPDIFFAALVYFNNPSNHKYFYIDCEDFLETWKHVCFTRFGNKYEKCIDQLYPLLAKEKSNLEIDVQGLGSSDAGNTVQLTQTQVTWIQDVLKDLENGTKLKTYPGSMLWDHPKLRHLNHHVHAYNKILVSTNMNLKQEALRLVDSLVAICNELLVTDRQENVWNVTTKSQES